MKQIHNQIHIIFEGLAFQVFETSVKSDNHRIQYTKDECQSNWRKGNKCKMTSFNKF